MSHLLVISAGMGTPSSSRMLGDRLAEATVKAMTAGGTPTPEVKVLELRDLAVDLATYYSSHVPTKTLQAAFGLVGTASGVIAVSPVLNAGVSGLFKLFFDLLGEILPEMRKGYAEGRPAHIPEAPTHASLVEKARVAGTLTEHRTVGVDDVTGQSPYEAALKGAN